MPQTRQAPRMILRFMELLNTQLNAISWEHYRLGAEAMLKRDKGEYYAARRKLIELLLDEHEKTSKPEHIYDSYRVPVCPLCRLTTSNGVGWTYEGLQRHLNGHGNSSCAFTQAMGEIQHYFQTHPTEDE